MKSRIGFGLVTAGLLAYAGGASAVTQDYTGLAFNSLTPFSSYTRIGDEPIDAAFGGLLLNQAGTIELGLGQANYTVTGTSIDDSGGLIGGSIDFGPSTVGMDFSGMSMFITGGHLDIKVNDGATGPTQPLPFGLGSATPDYELENGHLDVLLNGVAMTFSLCETGGFGGACGSTGDDEPWGSGQPYNTLNVGDNGGAEDLAMFLYMRGECADQSCPFYSVYNEVLTRRGWVRDYLGLCDRRQDAFYNDEGANGTFSGGGQVTSMVGTGDRDFELVCRRVENSDIYMKLALWGQDDSGDVPAPAALPLFALGLVGLGAAVRRRRQVA